MTAPPWWEGHGEMFPADPDLELLHTRNYSVRVWKLSEDAMLLQGAVMDTRPGEPVAARIAAAGGRDTGGPMGIHHMVVDLVVGYPSLIITDAKVVFETFPQPGCPGISAHYKELIGLSIARGFTHEVRQRFGGPRGCSHTTALLQAMGPVAVQSVFSMRRPEAEPGTGSDSGGSGSGSGDSGRSGWQAPTFMRDTCHVWSSEGEIWQNLTRGNPPPIPLPMQERMRDAGLDPSEIDPRA